MRFKRGYFSPINYTQHTLIQASSETSDKKKQLI